MRARTLFERITSYEVGAIHEAARRAVDFLTTEIGTPTAEALPYANQFAVVVELFRQIPRPTSAQYAAMRGWFWRTALTGYYDGWNTRKMVADLAAIERFRQGAKVIDVQCPPLSTRLWTADQYRRDSARTKALALMLAAAGPLDLRTGARIDSGRALAMTNDMQFHHFFPKAWLMRQETPYEEANLLANIVMLTAISNQAITDYPPAAYLKDEIDFCGEVEMRRRLESLLVSPQAFDAAMLGSGLPGCDAIELAALLIGESGGLPALATADPHALKRLPGVGAAKAARVAAAFELARRATAVEDRRRIAGSADVAAVVAPYLRGLRHERVVVVACDNSGSLLRVAPLTDGSADRSLIPVRDVLTAVLAVGGASFAVAHNHPSGSLAPSPQDTEATARLRRAAVTVGVRFLDHVILTETAWARVS